MSEPTRLLEGESAAARLLRAGTRDNPDAHSAHKAAVALGLGGAVATAAGASAATGASAALAASSATAASGVAAGTSVGVASVAAKWVVVGFVGGAVSVGGAATLGERLSTPVAAAPASIQPALTVAASPARRPALSGLRATPESNPALEPAPAPASPAPVPTFRSAATLPPAARHAAAPAVAQRDSGGRLGRDLSRIDETRRALRSGDPARALAQLDGYERGRETSFFDREAMLLRIEALIQQGQRGRATQLANDYFRRFPDDVHAPRLRALLHGSK